MRRPIFLFALLFSATAASSETLPLDEKLDKLIRQSLPVCEDTKIARATLPAALPSGLSGSLIRVDSSRPACAGQYVAVTTTSGTFYLGTPWFLEDADGATLEEKLKSFTWKHMKENFAPTIDRQRTAAGLYRVTLLQLTERGKVPLEGEIDPQGKVFFPGRFRLASADAAGVRLKAFEPFLANAPARGAAKPEVTIVEFSDFQCPSCKRAAHYGEGIVARFQDRVRYIRYDLPLMTSHPWALSAAMAGRAVYRQKPDLFWQFKKQIYENQDKLTAFTIDDFTRAFAQDHDLDLARYDGDVTSQEIRDALLKGVGTAFSNEVRATPTYMVNGVFVDAGDDGQALAAYVEKLLR